MDGAYNWHVTMGKVTQLWCTLLAEAIPIAKDILSPKVLGILERRVKSQCMDNSLYPSPKVMILELLLDADILFTSLEFFRNTVCRDSNTVEGRAFFAKHKVLQAAHIYLYGSTICNTLNTFALSRLQVLGCALGGAHEEKPMTGEILADESLQYLIGKDLAIVLKNILTPSVLRKLNLSMKEKCVWVEKKDDVDTDKTSLKSSSEANASLVTAMALFTATYVL